MATKEEKHEFSGKILARAGDGDNCMDVICEYCEEVGLEVEVAATLINDVLLARIHDEAESLNYIEKSSKLPGV